MINYPSKRTVTVCAHCLTEICWRGKFPCTEADGQSITDTEENIAKREVSEVELELEHTVVV